MPSAVRKNVKVNKERTYEMIKTAIGVIGAMESEIEAFRSKFGAEETEVREIYHAEVGEKNLYIAQSGIGKVNAAITAQRLVDLFKVNFLINSGVAGCISKELSTCDAVIADTLCYHDFNPLEILEENFPYTSHFKADKKLTTLALNACDRLSDGGKLFRYIKGVIVSGDCFVSDSTVVERLRKDFGALCTEMEGAAIAHVATANRIPFAVIRTMSDFADENADISFDKLERIAAARASEIVSDIVENL